MSRLLHLKPLNGQHRVHVVCAPILSLRNFNGRVSKFSREQHDIWQTLFGSTILSSGECWSRNLAGILIHRTSRAEHFATHTRYVGAACSFARESASEPARQSVRPATPLLPQQCWKSFSQAEFFLCQPVVVGRMSPWSFGLLEYVRCRVLQVVSFSSSRFAVRSSTLRLLAPCRVEACESHRRW